MGGSPRRPPGIAGRKGAAPHSKQPPELAYGRNAVLAAARAGRVERVVMALGLGPDPRLDELRGLARVVELDRARLDSIAGGAVHQGVVAELRPRSYLGLRDLLERSPTLLVALDGIQDPQNLGAILRSAEAFGAEGAILPSHRSAGLSPVAVKAASGATELLPLCQVSGLASAIPELRKAGLWCVALDAAGETTIWEFDFRPPVCVVVGGEGQGVHRLVKERCDATLRIPLRGGTESLNASAAAAAVLGEVGRQRLTTL